MKKPEGKHKPHMIYQSTIEAVSRVREYGASKHGSEETWITTTPMEHLDAARRHIDEAIEAVRTGDTERMYDKGGSEELHIANAICNLMFEIERIDRERRLFAKGDKI